jgi:hypothetical protein
MPFDLKAAVQSILRVREERKAGPVERIETRRFCARCGADIEFIDLGVVTGRAISAETCSYDCPLSGLHPRPEGSTVVKRYRVTEELIDERIV